MPANISSTITSESVRGELVEALQLDLVGPTNSHIFANELLPELPSHWYLTGFLVPSNAPIEQRTDETSAEEIDSAGETGGMDDNNPPDKPAARKSLLPSSIGISVFLAPGVDQVEITTEWGDYVFEGSDAEELAEEAVQASRDTRAVTANAAPTVTDSTDIRPKRCWRRIPRSAHLAIDVTSSDRKPKIVDVPESGGLKLVITFRPVPPAVISTGRVPAGARAMSVFLVNQRLAEPELAHAYRTFAFQAFLRVECTQPFVARPDLHVTTEGQITDEWDERVSDLQYRDAYEYAVGHGISAKAVRAIGGTCKTVETTWIPQAEVERVAPSAIPDVVLSMEALGSLPDGTAAAKALMPLVAHYHEWIEGQRFANAELTGARVKTRDEMLIHAQHSAKRIETGIQLLADAQILDAFRIANRAMARAARQREWIKRGSAGKPEQLKAPSWYPFQLAFMLMTLTSIANPEHADRETVDLLFFPTGGGKTEAYLALAAFTLVLRRLRNPGVRGCGMSVLMRYTMRLLTLDQLGRAAALMCALELEREQDPTRLGTWPFEIGLWVGQAATPNRMGGRGYQGPGKEFTAYTRTMHYKRDHKANPAPIPLEVCPWCGEKFTRDSFYLTPNEQRPLDLRVHCVNPACLFTGDRALPIVSVDEPIYRRLPAFIIATVDKFAALPWTGETGALFGLVDRHDNDGFYGPCQPGKGVALEGGHLPPPDLIIQDELHLISGPLGTIAGIYETAIDALSSRRKDSHKIRPKIIASTATVRRADTQIKALFERHEVTIFPPPGPDRRDSFFAHTESSSQTPARLYVGVAAQGRSPKVVQLKASLALMSAAQVAYEREGGKKNKANPADPYMTVLGYYNSLRELGGSRRIVEDEVRARLVQYAQHKRLEPEDRLFTDRTINYEVLELTSRVSTNEVADAKRKLTLPFSEEEHVDTALATNMISVGLDISRLGLMMVLGQPKLSAEYIQATSRVGRDPSKPGLVVTLLNVHKPRDRSHYERFETYHSSFYRTVEATSVTPFAPRALDRALPAVLVGLCRHLKPELTASQTAEAILSMRATLDDVAEQIAERARNHAWPPSEAASQLLHDQVLHRCTSLLDDWLNIAQEFKRTGTKLKYQKWEDPQNAQRLLFDYLDLELAGVSPIRKNFRANRSMRDVEPNVDLLVKNLNEWRDQP